MIDGAVAGAEPRPGGASAVPWLRRSAGLAARLAASMAFGALVFVLVFGASETDERDRAMVRATQLGAALASEIERFAHLPFALASDDAIVAAARGAPPAGLNERLAVLAERTGLEAIYVMNGNGLTTAASNHADPNSFLGERYDFRPYFREAMAGRTGTFFGVGATTQRPGYFVAMPVIENGRPIGAVTAKLSLAPLERDWTVADEAVFVTDADGVVLLASDPTWRYRTLEALDADRLADVRGSRQFAGAHLQPFEAIARDGTPVPPGTGGALHLAVDGFPDGWTLHYLADDGTVWVKAWLGAAVAMGLVATLFLALQHDRTRRVRTALSDAVAREGSLRLANERLAIEIEERRLAEQTLQRTQEELRRASRLAVLGQLAASVSHELSQPIAAMRNHLAADALHRGRSTSPPNASAERSVARLSGLIDRMEAITRQLKFFGKPGDGMMTPIDLRDVAPEAVGLLASNAGAAGVEVVLDLPREPVTVRGNRLRIEQVLVNLARNGIDAMEGTGGGRLTVAVERDGDWAVLRVTDEGSGLGSRTLDELSEPFVTTRASGQGMGLGLAISREIAREHGGALSASDGPDGGAEISLRLPLAKGRPEA